MIKKTQTSFRMAILMCNIKRKMKMAREEYKALELLLAKGKLIEL